MKITKRPEETICGKCGVLTVAWEEQAIVNRQLEEVPRKRDYYPISYIIRLKPDTATTYIVTPELESIIRRQPYSEIISLDAGKFNYAIVVPLQRDGRIGRILSEDSRIEEWHTAASAPVCECHISFVDKRW